MNDLELLGSLYRELELDAQIRPMETGIIPGIVDPHALNEYVQARTLALLNLAVQGGPAYATAIRIASAYLEAFVMGYRYRMALTEAPTQSS